MADDNFGAVPDTQPSPTEQAPSVPGPYVPPPTKEDDNFGAVPDENFGAVPDVSPTPAPKPDWHVPMALPGEPKSAIQQHFEDVIVKNFHAPMAIPAAYSASTVPGGQNPDGSPRFVWTPKAAQTFHECINAGWGASISGMMDSKSLPEYVTPETAPFACKIASNLTGMMGDLGTMATGMGAGMAAGALTGPLAPIASSSLGFIGSVSLPPAIRSLMIDHFKKGDVQNFDDFYARAAAATIEGAKSAAVAVGTLGAGKIMGALASPFLSKGATTVAQLIAQSATMAKLGAYMSGKVAGVADYLTSAATIIGFHAATSGMESLNPNPPEPAISLADHSEETKNLAHKLMDIYAQTGIHPDQVVEHASVEPTILQSLISVDKDIPGPYKEHTDSQNPQDRSNFTIVDGKLVPTRDAPMGGQDEFSPSAAMEELGYANGAPKEELKLHTAREIDPEAYKKMDEMEAQAAPLVKERAEIAPTLEAAKRLRLIRNSRPFSEPAPAEGSIQVESPEEQEILKQHGDVEGNIERDQELQKQIEGLKNNEITDRARLAYQKANEVLDSAARNRLNNMRIVLPNQEGWSRPLHEGMGLEDSNPNKVTLSEEGKLQILSPEQTKLETPQSQEELPLSGKSPDRPTHSEEGPDVLHPAIASAITGLPQETFEPEEIDQNAHMNDHPAVKELHSEPESKSDLPDYTQRILSKSYEKPDNSVAGKVKNGLTKALNFVIQRRSYQNIIDRLSPIKDISEQGYQLMRGVPDYMGTVEHMITKGTLDFKTGEINGESLQSIWGPMNKVQKPFEALMLALSDKNNSDLGLKTKFSDADRNAQIASATPEMMDAAKRTVGFINRVSQYLADSGYASQKQMDEMIEKYPWYFPNETVSEEDSVSPSRFSKSKTPFKTREGSEKQILNLPEAIANALAYRIKLAEENRATGAFLNDALKSGLVEKDETPLSIDQTSNQISKEEGGVNPQIVTMLRGVKRDLKPDQFSYRRNGQVEVYKTAQPIADAINNMNMTGSELGVFGKLMNVYATAERFAITTNPGFIARHIWKNGLTAAINAESLSSEEIQQKLPFSMAIEGLGHFMKNSPQWNDFLRSGGALKAYEELNQNYIQKNMWGMSNETGMMGKIGNVIKNPIDAIHGAATFMDTMTRAGQYARLAPEGSDLQTVKDAGYAAREVIPDPYRKGLMMQNYNRMVAFSNMEIQGIDKFARQFAEKPVQTFVRGSALLTVPALINAYLNKDDPRFQDGRQSRTDRDLYNSITAGPNSPILKSPVLFLEGIVFQSFPKLVLQSFQDYSRDGYNNFMLHLEENFHGFGRSAISGAMPNVIPGLAQAAIESYTNKNLYTGMNVTPDYMMAGGTKPLSPGLRAVEYTSETARAIGAMLNKIPGIRNLDLIAPTNIDNIFSKFDPMNHSVTFLLDRMLDATGQSDVKNKPSLEWNQIPVARELIERYPNMSAEAFKEFDDNLAQAKMFRNDQKLELQKLNNPQAMLALAQDPNEQDKWLKLDQIQKDIGSYRKQATELYYDTKTPRDQKTEIISQLYKAALETAVSGNKALLQYRGSLNNVGGSQ